MLILKRNFTEAGSAAIASIMFPLWNLMLELDEVKETELNCCNRSYTEYQGNRSAWAAALIHAKKPHMYLSLHPLCYNKPICKTSDTNTQISLQVEVLSSQMSAAQNFTRKLGGTYWCFLFAYGKQNLPAISLLQTQNPCFSQSQTLIIKPKWLL